LLLAPLLFSMACAAGDAAPTGGHNQLLEDVIAHVDSGEFQAARAALDKILAGRSLSTDERSAFEFEAERMRRIELDFSLSEQQARERVRARIPDLRAQEFTAWDTAGLLEHRVIDGSKRYFNRAPSNLFRLSEQARARRAQQTPFDDGPLEKAHPHHREIRDAVLASHKTGVAPRRVRITQSITVEADAVPSGETVRAWVPYPRALPGQQENIRYVSSEPAQHTIAPEPTLQRTVYFERAARAREATTFSVTYELTTFGQYHPIDPEKVTPVQPSRELAPYMGERPPHIVFTDDLRKFSRAAVGDERNPYRIAQQLFLAVDRIPWAGALEYSTIRNISDYALHAGHADCGQQTLLLMTLLRLNGIPARWQSGMVFSDGEYDNLHDWGWLYLAPYGWVPMDVTFGRLDAGDPQLDMFYLGGLDAYRLVFNDDYSQPFTPAKQHFRSETVDLQRGEVEWRGGNLYFDKWDYTFQARVLPPAQSTAQQLTHPHP
jgi:transglutaminase-like putative cysteine protease